MDERLTDLLRSLSMTIPAFASRLRGLLATPLATSAFVTVTIESGDTFATAHHGLGRAYRGAFIASASSAGAFTVDAPGSGATSLVTVRADAAVGSDVRIQLVVF